MFKEVFLLNTPQSMLPKRRERKRYFANHVNSFGFCNFSVGARSTFTLNLFFLGNYSHSIQILKVNSSNFNFFFGHLRQLLLYTVAVSCKSLMTHYSNDLLLHQGNCCISKSCILPKNYIIKLYSSDYYIVPKNKAKCWENISKRIHKVHEPSELFCS